MTVKQLRRMTLAAVFLSGSVGLALAQGGGGGGGGAGGAGGGAGVRRRRGRRHRRWQFRHERNWYGDNDRQRIDEPRYHKWKWRPAQKGGPAGTSNGATSGPGGLQDGPGR